MTETWKTCTKCDERKALSDFYSDKYAPSGYKSECKECTKEQHRTAYRLREEYAEYHRKKAKKRYDAGYRNPRANASLKGPPQ